MNQIVQSVVIHISSLSLFLCIFFFLSLSSSHSIYPPLCLSLDPILAVENYYGQDCLEECLCQNDAACDHVTGNCTCLRGWDGPLCAVRCPSGYYGDRCGQECRCGNHSSFCDSETGACTCTSGWLGNFDCL